MLSNKWTFSLKILVLMLAFGFVASSAMGEFEIKILAEDADVSFADKIQVAYGAPTTIMVQSAQVVQADTTATFTGTDATHTAAIGVTDLELDDFQVIAYNHFGGTAPLASALTDLAMAPTPDGKNFTMTLALVPVPADPTAPTAAEIEKVLILIPKHAVELADPTLELDGDGARTAAGKSAAASLEIHFVGANNGDPDSTGSLTDGMPTVYSIVRPGAVLLPVTEATVDVVVTLSEEAKKDTFTKERFDISNADITAVTHLGGFAPVLSAVATGRDDMIHKYVLTVTPKYANKDPIVIKINDFESQEKPGPEKYTAPATDAARTEGVHMLTIKVGKEDPPDKTAGIEVKLLEGGIIPKDGYLVVTKSRADSAVRDPSGTADGDDPKEVPSTTNRQPFGRTYNIVGGDDLPNLETFLTNGGTIDLVVSAEGASTGDLVISEIMWGSDASIDPDSFKSQYIEIRNTSGSQITMGKEDHKLVFYGAGQELPDMSVAASNIQDRVGTVGASGYWSVAGKGQGGRTGVDESPGDVVAITPTQALISMQRVIDAAGVAADGTMASSWAASEPPGVNFDPNKEGIRIGSPGRAPESYPVAPTPEPEPTPAPVVPVAEADDIMITEIMVDTGDGRLPQWIELTNVSGADVSLAGWSLMITNSEADADVIGASVSINLSGVLGVGGGTDAGGTMGKSLLLVGGSARSSSNLAGSDRVVDISSQVDQRGRYTFISTMAFMAALIPPQETGVLAYGDTAGNLDAAEAWDIPMDETGRSSLIRREMLDDGMATMGTAANGWVLASSTSLVSGPATWYGSDEDAGTPGYDAGGPLPVELSHFRPARDKATGAVVITWSTQSELNNAGFFIKRSQQRDGQFQVINAAMVPGAGTTSEKQFYTYTDTTAQPNVVYYYQIEDVSLDGNRQTLTNGIRLKGHIGAAGKLTTTWGDLKTHE